jgi:flagellar protein FlgJ
MADDLLAGNMAGNRAFGIADAILRQLVPGAKPGNKA